MGIAYWSRLGSGHLRAYGQRASEDVGLRTQYVEILGG